MPFIDLSSPNNNQNNQAAQNSSTPPVMPQDLSNQQPAQTTVSGMAPEPMAPTTPDFSNVQTQSVAADSANMNYPSQEDLTQAAAGQNVESAQVPEEKSINETTDMLQQNNLPNVDTNVSSAPATENLGNQTTQLPNLQENTSNMVNLPENVGQKETNSNDFADLGVNFNQTQPQTTQVGDTNQPIAPAIGNEQSAAVSSENLSQPTAPNAVAGSSLPETTPPSQTSVPVQEQNTSEVNLELSGTAKGKESEVKEIFNQADKLVTEKEKSKIIKTQSNGKTGSLAPASAGEKFFSDRANIEDFLKLAEEKGASDLHLSAEYPPMLRIDGRLLSLGGQALTLERITNLFDGVLQKHQWKQLEKDLDIDFSYSIASGTRFRVNIFKKKGKYAGAFRLIPSRIRTIAELGLPDIIYDFAKEPHGLILVTGPTGHGKSTTLASIIQEINLNEAKHILTIEDPIEYVFPKAKALIDQREVGADVTGFKRALRAALREDPDVVLVGEMRDFETIASTITVAETGHLVLSTLHTNSAAQSVDRMIDVFPDAQQAQIRAQLANVITAIVAQRLVPLNKGGRKAVLEIMIATPAIKNAIREAKTYQIDNMIQTNAEVGMVTLEKSLMQLIRNGDLSLEQAKTYTTKPDELVNLMKNN